MGIRAGEGTMWDFPLFWSMLSLFMSHRLHAHPAAGKRMAETYCCPTLPKDPRMRTLRLLLVPCLLSVAMLSSAFAGSGFQTDLLNHIEYVQKEIVDLENAIPDKKFSWRPAKGVRSVSEVYAHLAFANFMMAQIAGIKLPEDITITGPADAEKWEKTLTGKKELSERLVRSFEFLKASVKELSDADLEKSVEFFGNPMTVRSLFMLILSHQHEHLGQSIAYARMAGVVPPWTAARDAQGKGK